MSLSLKVVMNKERTKVLFAEANSDFINVLLSFLTLPLGKFATFLNDDFGAAAVPGSLNSLRSGVADLDEAYFCVGGAKQMLLDPQSLCRADFYQLALDIYNTSSTYYVCPNIDCRRLRTTHVSLYRDIAACDCGKSLSSPLFVDEPPRAGAFTVSPLSFIITDDLRVAPIVVGAVRTLCNLGITDTRGAEIMLSSFNIKEIKNLLRLALTSANPLTDMVLKKAGLRSTAAKPELGIMLHNIHKNNLHTRKMALKVYLLKSSNKFLFAEAMGDFVDYLFSFLTVPLGGVAFLLGGNTGLTNIDNLYGSVDGIDKKCFRTENTKTRLVGPKLPYSFRPKNQFLPLGEDSPPTLFHKIERKTKMNKWEDVASCNYMDDGSLVTSFKRNEELYVKKLAMCIVKDDLSVSSSLTTAISMLNGLGIPLSDVMGVELQIGLEEALAILKASLTSETPLTDALIKPMLNKLPELERKSKNLSD